MVAGSPPRYFRTRAVAGTKTPHCAGAHGPRAALPVGARRADDGTRCLGCCDARETGQCALGCTRRRGHRDPQPACARRHHAQPRALTGFALAAIVEITDQTRESSAWRGFAWSMTRDLKLAIRSKAELGVQLLFYVD